MRIYASADVYQQWNQALSKAVVELRTATRWAVAAGWHKYEDFTVTKEKMHGFGAFKIGIENARGGVESADKFDARKDIKGLHVLFQPEVKTDSSGLRQKTFISGCSVQEAPKNDVDTSKPKENSGTGTGD